MPDVARKGGAGAVSTATVEYEVPDGGYGWVVVVCAFHFIALPMGISASFSIYYEEWLDYFSAGRVRTALVGSMGSGCVPLLGKILSSAALFYPLPPDKCTMNISNISILLNVFDFLHANRYA